MKTSILTILIAALLATIGCQKPEGPRIDDYFDPDIIDIEILSHQDHDPVFLDSGSTSEIISGHIDGFENHGSPVFLYIAVSPSALPGVWFPQRNPVNFRQDPDNNWELPVNFVGAEVFDVIAFVVADIAAIDSIFQRPSPSFSDSEWDEPYFPEYKRSDIVDSLRIIQ